LPPSSHLNRRAFLQAALAAAAAAGSNVACSRNRSPWRFFSLDEARALAAVADQIIPPDQDPGASWAGVVNYIDRQLIGPYENLQDTYRRGLAGIDESSSQLYGKLFADLASEKQEDLLHRFEDGKVPGSTWNQLSPKSFFALLVDHTMQGFYGDPRHGGNRDRIGWKMLNLPYPPVRGRIRPDQFKPRSG